VLTPEVITPPGPRPPAAVVCTVPKLTGRTLAQARASLAASACRLGKVSKPKPRRGRRLPVLVVKTSSPMAGAADAAGVVTLTLGPRPAKHRH
jgi:beta-lactam-binding protein with PASTA domain